jgi:hypothetical protein
MLRRVQDANYIQYVVAPKRTLSYKAFSDYMLLNGFSFVHKRVDVFEDLKKTTLFELD